MEPMEMNIMTSAMIATAMTTVHTSNAQRQMMRQTGTYAKIFGIHGTIGMTIMTTMMMIIIVIITILIIIILMNE